jgi:hypothetical protein
MCWLCLDLGWGLVWGLVLLIGAGEGVVALAVCFSDRTLVSVGLFGEILGMSVLAVYCIRLLAVF